MTSGSVGVVFLLLCELTVFKFLAVRLIRPQAYLSAPVADYCDR